MAFAVHAWSQPRNGDPRSGRTALTRRRRLDWPRPGPQRSSERSTAGRSHQIDSAPSQALPVQPRRRTPSTRTRIHRGRLTSRWIRAKIAAAMADQGVLLSFLNSFLFMSCMQEINGRENVHYMHELL